MLPEFIEKGGPLVVIIGFCSIFSMAVFFERLFHFFRAGKNLKTILASTGKVIEKAGVDEACKYLRNCSGPVAAVLYAGLIKRNAGRERSREHMEDSAIHEIARLEKHVSMIAVIAQVTPLLGLLGTVLGMIKAFIVIQEKGGVVNPSDLAGGISEALITTAAGLAVAIPSYIVYSYLISRIEKFSLAVEESEVFVMDFFDKENDLDEKKKKHS